MTSNKPKVKKIVAKKGYNLVVILTIPLRFDREHTIGELTDIFEDAAKQLIESIPGAKLNRALDVGLDLDPAFGGTSPVFGGTSQPGSAGAKEASERTPAKPG